MARPTFHDSFLTTSVCVFQLSSNLEAAQIACITSAANIAEQYTNVMDTLDNYKGGNGGDGGKGNITTRCGSVFNEVLLMMV